MTTNYPRLPDAALHQPDTDYFRGLVTKTGLTQRGAARALGVDERTMRNYASGKHTPPYTLQFCLELLAADAAHQVADAPMGARWLRSSVRRISDDDVGKILLGRGPGRFVAARVKKDSFGVVLEPLPGHGVDGGDVPASAITDYVLIEDPTSY